MLGVSKVYHLPAPLPSANARQYLSLFAASQVVGTRTTVDVQWQDGSRAERAPARGFLPVSFHDEHDFAAGDFVELRDPFADMDESPADGGIQPSQVSVWPAFWGRKSAARGAVC